MRIAPLVAAALALAACGDDDAAGTPDAMTGIDSMMMSPDAAIDAPPGVAPAHLMVIAKPYNADGDRADLFEVLAVDDQGTVTQFDPPKTFTMKRAPYGTIVFTPDGKYGFAPLEDGNLGEFSLDPDGTPHVLQADFDGAFYMHRVVMDPSGTHLWVIDRDTRENGGGVYRVDIGADGALTDRGLVVAAKSPGGFSPKGTKAVLAAKDALTTTPSTDEVHLLDLAGATPTRVAGANAWTDEDAIIGSWALSNDGTIFMAGDVSGFSSTPNSVATFAVTATGITPLTTVDLEDPEAIAISADNSTAIVTSAFGDAIFVLSQADGGYDTDGEVEYMGAGPMLPGDIAVRGEDVWVSELSSIRHLRFVANGVTDLGSLNFDGDSLDQINGAIGITP